MEGNRKAVGQCSTLVVWSSFLTFPLMGPFQEPGLQIPIQTKPATKGYLKRLKARRENSFKAWHQAHTGMQLVRLLRDALRRFHIAVRPFAEISVVHVQKQ